MIIDFELTTLCMLNKVRLLVTKWLVAYCVALDLFVVSGNAYNLKQPSQQELIKQSDIAIVGTVTTLNKVKSKFGAEFAIVRVKAIIKGKPSKVIEIWTQTLYPEATVHCVVGGEYLFFLEKGVDGRFVTLYGRFGAVEIAR